MIIITIVGCRASRIESLHVEMDRYYIDVNLFEELIGNGYHLALLVSILIFVGVQVEAFMVILFFASVITLFSVKRKYKDLRLSYLRGQRQLHLSSSHHAKKP